MLASYALKQYVVFNLLTTEHDVPNFRPMAQHIMEISQLVCAGHYDSNKTHHDQIDWRIYVLIETVDVF